MLNNVDKCLVYTATNVTTFQRVRRREDQTYMHFAHIKLEA